MTKNVDLSAGKILSKCVMNGNLSIEKEPRRLLGNNTTIVYLIK